MSKQAYRDGFTLVELTLAMLFIGLLSISIVLIISNTVSAFQRGMKLSRVNATGTDLVDDMRASIQSSSARGLVNTCYTNVFASGVPLGQEQREKCVNDNAKNYVAVSKIAKIKINGVEEEVPILGAFCTGSYTYIWNSGYFEAENVTFNERTNKEWAKIRYRDGGDIKEYPATGAKPFRLLRIQDEARVFCLAAVDNTGNSYELPRNGISNVFDISTISYGSLRDDIVDLLPPDSGNDLAVYDISVARPAVSENGDNAFYSVSFILGTVTGGVNIVANGNACVAPNDIMPGNYNYCAINKFNFAVQVNGG